MKETSGTTRRSFMTTTATAGAAVAAIPALAIGPRPVDPAVRVGLVGCGHRGTGAIAKLLESRQRVELVAMGDLQQSRIDQSLTALREVRTRDKKPLDGINVAPDHCFTGFDAYKRVIDSDIDAVFLVTPPWARPEQCIYAIKAGRHMFLEKPCGTDPVSIQRMLALEDEANRKGLNIISGCERRLAPMNIELVQHVWDGAIGDVMSVRAYSNREGLWYRERQPGMSDRDFWLHNWYHVCWMSGDLITEVHVHDLDLVNWLLRSHPIKAYGMGGRQYYTERGGNIYDHFCVEYEYPGGLRMTSMSRYIPRTDSRIQSDFIGTKGTATMSLLHGARITGATSWSADKAYGQGPGESGFVVDCVRENRSVNNLRDICESTLTGIMGREAAYTGKIVTWDEMMMSTLQLVPEDVSRWDGIVGPIPKPGDRRI